MTPATDAPRRGTPGPRYLYALSFCAGMSIMAVELSASRLVAPVFGTSTYVWTNIIGVIMIALSIGYVVGGRLADRRDGLAPLLKLLLGACGWLLALPFAGVPLLRALAGALTGLQSSFSFVFVGSLVGILLLFAPPIVLLGMTSPFLVRALARQGEVGAAAGRVFAVSTVGSVLGTFLPVLVFIPTVGTARTILVFAGLLAVVAALGLRPRGAVVAGALLAGALALPAPAGRSTPGHVWSGDSAYQYIEVYDQGPMRYLAYNDALGVQTAVNRAGPLTGLYYDYYALLPMLLDHPARGALILGLGGGVIASQYAYFQPDVQVDGVEIDPTVIRLARDYFGLGPATRTHDQDGRVFAARAGRTYDVVIVDAYTQQIYVPFHMATKEFFGQVRGCLGAGGLVAMNVSAARDDAPLLTHICASLQAVFPHVYRMRVPASNDYIVLASPRALAFTLPAGTYGEVMGPLAAQVNQGFREVPPLPGVRPLTDDWAPVEHMVDWELLARRVRPGAAS